MIIVMMNRYVIISKREFMCDGDLNVVFLVFCNM